MDLAFYGPPTVTKLYASLEPRTDLTVIPDLMIGPWGVRLIDQPTVHGLHREETHIVRIALHLVVHIHHPTLIHMLPEVVVHAAAPPAVVQGALPIEAEMKGHTEDDQDLLPAHTHLEGMSMVDHHRQELVDIRGRLLR